MRSVVCILVGIALGLFLAVVLLWEFTWDWSLRVIDLLQLTATITIAFILDQFIKGRTDRRRVEADIVLEELKKVAGAAELIRASYVNLSTSANRAREVSMLIERLRTLANLITGVEGLLEECRPGKVITEIEAIKKSYFAYKGCLTGTRDLFGVATFNRVESISRTLSREVFRAIVEVNRLA